MRSRSPSVPEGGRAAIPLLLARESLHPHRRSRAAPLRGFPLRDPHSGAARGSLQCSAARALFLQLHPARTHAPAPSPPTRVPPPVSNPPAHHPDQTANRGIVWESSLHDSRNRPHTLRRAGSSQRKLEEVSGLKHG